ncbi:MAG: hypothetical protein MPJ24_11960 [Pirellulaceae bacterium]|nr:hypothetical protein [Pirellulaceae bacterium]
MKNWFTNRLIRGRILAVMPFFSTLLFSPFLLSAQEKGEGAQVAPKPTEVVKRPLDHESYDRWNRIQGQKLSDDGNWLFYTLRPGKGDPRLFVKNRDSSSPIELEKGSNLQFYRGNRLVFLETLELKKEEVAQEEPKKENNEPQEEKKEEKKKDEKKKPETKKQLVMISLDHLLPSANKIDGSARRVLADNVSSFTLSKEGPSWIAYRVKAAKKEDEKKEEGEKKEKQTE